MKQTTFQRFFLTEDRVLMG